MNILIVVQDKLFSEIIKKSVSQEGYVIDIIDNEYECEYLIKEVSYDLIIIDDALTNISGNILCSELRRYNVEIPIILLTADKLHDRLVGLQSGADDCLSKPFEMDELVARIKAFQRRIPTLQPLQITIGSMTLDKSKRQIQKGEQHINLTEKEFLILEILMRNQGTIVTHAYIEEHVWGLGMINADNLVSVHIKNLRKKLGDRKREIIQTVVGRGYCFFNDRDT